MNDKDDLTQAKEYISRQENEKALPLLKKLHEADPDNTQVLYCLGFIWHHQKQYPEAIEAYKKILMREAEHPSGYFNMSMSYDNLDYAKIHGVSFPAHQRRLTLKAAATLSLSHCLIDENQIDEAREILKDLLKNESGVIDAYYALANIERRQHHFTEAIVYYRKILSLDENELEAKFGLAVCLLAEGQFQEGLAFYESRLDMPYKQPFLSQITAKKWQGENLENKTLLVYAEQGLGDVIQFCRYILRIQKGSGKIFFMVYDLLLSLMISLANVDKFYKMEETVPKTDYAIPLLSLPKVMQTTYDTIPADVPYLTVSKDKKLAWAARLKPYRTYFKVGICWENKPGHPMARSCPLSYFLQLASIPSLSLLSLQKDNPSSLPSAIMDVSHDFVTFEDTAACIEALDLIICVDTAVAHLAGALSKPVWVLLAYHSEWRWGVAGDTTPWYPTMRLFRQSTQDDWDSVFVDVYKSVQARVRKN